MGPEASEARLRVDATSWTRRAWQSVPPTRAVAHGQFGQQPRTCKPQAPRFTGGKRNGGTHTFHSVLLNKNVRFFFSFSLKLFPDNQKTPRSKGKKGTRTDLQRFEEWQWLDKALIHFSLFGIVFHNYSPEGYPVLKAEQERQRHLKFREKKKSLNIQFYFIPWTVWPITGECAIKDEHHLTPSVAHFRLLSS